MKSLGILEKVREGTLKEVYLQIYQLNLTCLEEL